MLIARMLHAEQRKRPPGFARALTEATSDRSRGAKTDLRDRLNRSQDLKPTRCFSKTTATSGALRVLQWNGLLERIAVLAHPASSSILSGDGLNETAMAASLAELLYLCIAHHREAVLYLSMHVINTL